MKGKIGAALLALAVICSAPALAQEGPDAASRGHVMKMIEHQPLTMETARNAVDALLLLREKYRDRTFEGHVNGPAGVIRALKNSAARDEIEADLKRFGFASIEDWVNKFASLGLAVSYVRRNGDGKIEKKIEEVKRNKELPDALRKQIVAMLGSLIPPKGNIEVARAILADEAYADKVKQLMPHPDDGRGTIRPMRR